VQLVHQVEPVVLVAEPVAEEVPDYVRSYAMGENEVMGELDQVFIL
jgi:hypothetical protein